MSVIYLKGQSIQTSGELPAIGSLAPDFLFTRRDLSEGTLYSEEAKYKILNIFPSLDTGTCAMSVRQFNKRATMLPDTLVLCLSMDLPFAHERFCSAEGISHVTMGSLFRSNFNSHYGVQMIEGPLRKLMSRCVIILGSENQVLYTEQVSEIVDEPDYAKAIDLLKRSDSTVSASLRPC